MEAAISTITTFNGGLINAAKDLIYGVGYVCRPVRLDITSLAIVAPLAVQIALGVQAPSLKTV